MDNWIVGGYREETKQSVGYTQIDTPDHLGKVRVFEPDSEAIAHQIVREHNAHAAMVEALQSAQTTLVSIKDFIGDMTDSHIRTGKRIPAASILQQVMDMAENQALETQASLRLSRGEK